MVVNPKRDFSAPPTAPALSEPSRRTGRHRVWGARALAPPPAGKRAGGPSRLHSGGGCGTAALGRGGLVPSSGGFPPTCRRGTTAAGWGGCRYSRGTRSRLRGGVRMCLATTGGITCRKDGRLWGNEHVHVQGQSDVRGVSPCACRGIRLQGHSRRGCFRQVRRLLS